MTFKDVVIKNFKGSFQKYLAYFLSGSFSILLFFMYSTLLLNKELNAREDADALIYIFPITIVAIALFSVFFINYAHSAFIKGRNKEFGIYISLGMNTKELSKLINVEILLNSVASMIAGIGVGSLFSRLFQMIILKLLGIKDISFYLDYRSFLLTIIVFVLIYASVMLRTVFRMRKIDISGFFREARKSEGREYSKKDPVFGGLGLIIMAFSIIFLVVISGNEDLNSNPLVLITYMITAFLGVYLTLSNGGNLILHILKKSRHYYKNLLSLTELHYKFNQNKKIIFVLSILSTMTIFLVASPFSLLNLTESIAEMSVNDLDYVETKSVNILPQGELDRILGEKIKSNTTLKFIYLSTKKSSIEYKDSKPVISVTEYNAFTGSNIALNEGEAENIIIDWMPGKHGIESGSTLQLYVGEDTYPFNVKASRSGNWVASMESFPANSAIVISDKDYEKLLSKMTEQNIGYYHLIKFRNWKESKPIVTALRTELGDSELPVFSILESYEGLKSNYSVFLFVTTVLGVMFFVAGGSVLYFKQFTELPEAKVTFKKLFKIGIAEQEMKSIIGKELFVVFFLPLLFGTFMGVSLIYLMTYIVGGDAIINEFLQNAFIVVAIYFASQGVFYFITKKKYVGEIVKG